MSYSSTAIPPTPLTNSNAIGYTVYATLPSGTITVNNSWQALATFTSLPIGIWLITSNFAYWNSASGFGYNIAVLDPTNTQLNNPNPTPPPLTSMTGYTYSNQCVQFVVVNPSVQNITVSVTSAGSFLLEPDPTTATRIA